MLVWFGREKAVIASYHCLLAGSTDCGGGGAFLGMHSMHSYRSFDRVEYVFPYFLDR